MSGNCEKCTSQKLLKVIHHFQNTDFSTSTICTHKIFIESSTKTRNAVTQKFEPSVTEWIQLTGNILSFIIWLMKELYLLWICMSWLIPDSLHQVSIGLYTEDRFSASLPKGFCKCLILSVQNPKIFYIFVYLLTHKTMEEDELQLGNVCNVCFKYKFNN